MSKTAERIQQALATLRATLGTPYQTNAENALRALVQRAKGA